MSRSVILLSVLVTALAGCQKAPTSADAEAGKALFDEHCAVCHGPGGNVREAAQHDAKTPDLREIAKRSGGGYVPVSTLAEIIDGRRVISAHGRTMPVWGEHFGEDSAARIASLVAYIESIQTR